jgi:DNA-binding CsgD family transcriptional regulator
VSASQRQSFVCASSLRSSPVVAARTLLGLYSSCLSGAAAAITYVDAETGAHRVLVNGGYREHVVEHFVHGFDHHDHLDLIRDARGPVFWRDIPGFRSSDEAVELYGRCGFREGTTVAFHDERAVLVGMLHVSFRDNAVDDTTRTAAAELARLCGDVIDDHRAGQALKLTPRELQVLSLVAQGMDNVGIAARLFISRRTVATHLESIFAKTGTSTRAEAAVRGVSLGLISA